MKAVYGVSAALLLGTSMLAGTAIARSRDDNPPPHAHFTASGQSHAHEDVVPTRSSPGSWAWSHGANGGTHPNPPPQQNFNASTHANTNASAATNSGNNNGGNHNGNWAAWAHNNNGGHAGNAPHPHWNAGNLHDHNVAHFSAQDRSTWQHGHWQHGRHHGRDGWWWYSGGNYFFYDQPVYPYPGYVSDYYYDDDYYDGGDGYGDYTPPGYGAEPGDGGYYWYYCNNPAGYYPYVKSCRGPWRAVTPTPDAQQQGYDQDDDSDQGPPPGYSDDDRGPPPGYNNGPAPRDQYNGPDDDDQGPPPGYNDDRGPPPGYDNGPDDDDDNGPPR